jgi:competence protein ComEA
MKFHTKLIILLIGILLGLLGAGILDLLSSKPRGSPITLLPPPSPSPLRIHVTGAVHSPGVYTLSPGSIVQDAIEAAGGALPDASLGLINLATPLRDGQQIHLASTEENASSEENPSSTEPSASYLSSTSSKLNINTADEPELESLPGIGPSLAEKIVEYRRKNGPFTSIEDLLNVPGIGPAKLEQIQNLIVIR